MKQCPACKTGNPSNATFCMACGKPLEAQSPATPPVLKKSPTWIWALLPVAALAVIALGFGLGNMLQAKQNNQPTAVLGATTEVKAPPLLQAQAQAPEPVLSAPKEGEQMPDDVREWLRHLERTEADRRNLTTRQLGEMTAMAFQMKGAGVMEMLTEVMNDPEGEHAEEKLPASEMHDTALQLRSQWTDLQNQFHQKQPPASCVDIRNRYDAALQETSAMVFDIADVLDQATQPGADAKELVARLTGMKGKSTGIDDAGRKTDALIQEICDYYKTQKWFLISGDIGSDGMLKVLGGF